MPNRVRIGGLSSPARVVAPISVKGFSGRLMVRLCMPLSTTKSTLYSSIAG